VSFKLTYIGHAGWLVKKNNFKAMFDPWFNPYGTFLNSWHQFPDNSSLISDDLFSDLDFLYISHAHKDHCDEWTLNKIDKKTKILIPRFRDKVLKNTLIKIGFTNISELSEEDNIEIKGIKINLIVEDGFNDRDSAIILDSGKGKIINLNDCHPSFEKIKKYSKNVDLLLMQCSSAIWWPCVYDYPLEKMMEKCKIKKRNVLNRAVEYGKCIKPKYIVPNAGPPLFLHNKFNFWDETRKMDFNPFPLHDEINSYLNQNNLSSFFVIPGSVIDITDSQIFNKTDIKKRNKIYDNFYETVLQMREEKKQKGLLLEKYVPKQDITNLIDKFSSLIIDIKKNSKVFIHKISFPFLIIFKDHSSWIIDFKLDESDCFKKYTDQEYKYSFTFDAEIVNYLINQPQIDFDEYFLSMRFKCSRQDDVFNEFLFTMFKNLDLKRFKLSESVFISENMVKKEMEDTFLVKINGKNKKIQKYCPHKFVNLEKCGIIKDEVLTCPLHNWKFDLQTGKCLTSDEYCLSVEEE